MSDTIQYGSYVCRRCKADYIVNDGTWRLCTPEFCHDCTEYLATQTTSMRRHADAPELGDE